MTDPLSLTPVDSLVVTVLVDNSFDGLLAGAEHVRRTSLSDAPIVDATLFEDHKTMESLVAEHGFAALVDVTVNGREHRLLFDAGISPMGLVGNLERMQIDLPSIEAIVLSHGHMDHVGGMEGIVRRMGSSRLPIFIHPLVFTRRRLAIPGAEPLGLPAPSRSAFVEAGLELTEDEQPRFLLDGAVLITGEIDRASSFEPGMPPVHQALTADGWVPDPLVLDDQALVVNVRDQGLVVLSGCGHAGIVNTVQFAQRQTGVEKVFGVIGGFHLSGPFYEPVVPKVVDAFAAMAPSLILPGHCTGWKAIAALAAAMPDAVHPSSVGTRVIV